MNAGERIRARRIEMGMTQEELAEKLGLQKSAIAKYENGRVQNIKRLIMERMAAVLDTTPSYLFALDDIVTTIRKTYESRIIPLFASVSAGTGTLATGDVIGEVDLPAVYGNTSEYFALVVKGNSMEPKIADGSTIIVRKQPDAEDGDIIVAIVNGDEGYCKKLRKYTNGIALESLNPAYEPKYFSDNDIEALPVTVAGKVMEVRTKL